MCPSAFRQSRRAKRDRTREAACSGAGNRHILMDIAMRDARDFFVKPDFTILE
jgi:hypothetical protein